MPKFMNDSDYSVSIYVNKKLRNCDYDYNDSWTYYHDRIDVNSGRSKFFNWRDGIGVVKISDGGDDDYWPDFTDNDNAPVLHIGQHDVVEIYDAQKEAMFDDVYEGYGLNILGDDSYEFYTT